MSSHQPDDPRPHRGARTRAAGAMIAAAALALVAPATASAQPAPGTAAVRAGSPTTCVTIRGGGMANGLRGVAWAGGARHSYGPWNVALRASNLGSSVLVQDSAWGNLPPGHVAEDTYGYARSHTLPIPASGSGSVSVRAWVHGTAPVGYAPTLTITWSGCSAPRPPSLNPVPLPPPVGTPTHPLVGNPPSDYPYSPAVEVDCATVPLRVSACNKAMLALIDDALAGEGYGPLVLPAGYASMSTDAQMLAVTNAERVVRGLPAYAGPVPSLDAAALAGAKAGTDPTDPNSGPSWGSIWAEGYPTPLLADFAWMYDDGFGGPNADCKTADAPRCWGHRDNILAPYAGEAGVAHATIDGGAASYAELFQYQPPALKGSAAAVR